MGACFETVTGRTAAEERHHMSMTVRSGGSEMGLILGCKGLGERLWQRIANALSARGRPEPYVRVLNVKFGGLVMSICFLFTKGRSHQLAKSVFSSVNPLIRCVILLVCRKQ